MTNFKLIKTQLTIFICCIGISMAFSQDYKFGKVSKQELQEKFHPKDSSANAAVLYKSENISFLFTQSNGFMQEREVHERIKIYNKEGYDWATRKIFLYQGSSGAKKEKLSNVKGYTYNVVGNKIEKTKLKKDGIFENKLNDFTKVNIITMPNIKDGCVIEFIYKEVSPFLEIDDIVFQYNIPVNKLDLRVSTPQYYSYNMTLNPKAFYSPKINRKVETRTAGYTSSNGSSINKVSASKNYSNNKFEYKENIILINDTNIPSLKAESFSGSMNNYRAKMSLELSAILDNYGSVEKSFTSSWEKVSKTIYKRPSFGGQINKTNFFKNNIASLTKDIDNAFQKAVILTNHIRSKIKWNGYYGVSGYKGTKNAYKIGEGNVADINLLLIAMLKSEGVNVNPVLISTKDNGIPLYPSAKGFNYVICMIEYDGKYALIDAADPNGSLNVLPERVLNWQGRLIKEDGTSSWVPLTPQKQSVQSSSINVKITDDFSISGKVRQMQTANLALRARNRFNKLSKESQVKLIERNKGNFEVSNLEIKNKDDNSLSIGYDYEFNDAVDEIGDKLYFSPLLFMAEKENPFKLDERKYPIDFSIPFKENYKVNIMLPQGYKVESLPKAEAFEFKGGAVKYTFIVKQNGNFIQLSTDFDLKSTLIDPQDYSVFKEFYGKIIEKQTEKIVLTKE